MSENRNSILQMKIYYQEFHHKCISWYVTVIGFFLAGTIAAPVPSGVNTNTLGYTIIGFSALLSLLFFLCIFHFSERIDKLNSYLDSSDDPPNNWYTESKKFNIGIHGIGSWFFLSIIIAMQVAVIGFVALKFLC